MTSNKGYEVVLSSSISLDNIQALGPYILHTLTKLCS